MGGVSFLARSPKKTRLVSLADNRTKTYVSVSGARSCEEFEIAREKAVESGGPKQWWRTWVPGKLQAWSKDSEEDVKQLV